MTADVRSQPLTPPDLDARSRAFWRTTVAAYELTDVETELLRECCRPLDECESLRTAVDT